MTKSKRFVSGLSVAVAAMTLWAAPAFAEYHGGEISEIPFDKLDNGIFPVEGEFVHNIGELQLHITNWGLIGSRPGSQTQYSEAPSAMWPAGSGVDYLWSAGLWIGALKNNVPLCSTGQYANEFLANPDDPLDTVYETFQGAVGGARYPDPGEDDDGDGSIDEDPMNGIDDDGDGAIDEDFRAIGSQHFRCVMRDNTALAIEAFSEHEPLDLEVVQESFCWENDSVDDFIGFEFELRNIGVVTLKDVYLGFFADCDVGPRGQGGIAEDDLPGFYEGRVKAADGSWVPISVAYMYDADGDNAQATGFFGIMFLDHPIDSTGETAPDKVGITSFQAFAGRQPFERGGDPNNDAERYELLSQKNFDNTPPLFEEGKQNDFRILLASGPFVELDRGETLTFRAAMVAGEGENGLKRHAADAALTFYGAFFDRDVNPDTGVGGFENQICKDDFVDGNDIFNIFMNPCDTIGAEAGSVPPISDGDLDDDGCVYVNSDCFFEMGRRLANDCAIVTDPEKLGGCTGVLGKEYEVNWLVGLAPTAPDLRLWQADNRVHIFWNNISQIIPDVRLQEVDFESYRVWRADGWDRPFGSSIENGPESKLWSLIAEFDVVSFFEDRREADGQLIVQELPLGANTGLDVIRYTPAIYREGSIEQAEAAPIRDLVVRILEDPEFSWFKATIDPAKVMRYTDSEGLVSQVGRKYPQLRDFEDSYATVDTCYWIENDVEFFEFVDESVFNGVAYFYSVTASDFEVDPATLTPLGPGLVGDPQSNFDFAVPRFDAQTAEERARDGHNIYVFPNPATRDALDQTRFNPNGEDPTGVRVVFANLPASMNSIKVYTLAGDLVDTIEHDGTQLNCDDDSGFDNCGGSAYWDLVSRNGQEVVSGVYLFSVESDDSAFERVVGRFVVIR